MEVEFADTTLGRLELDPEFNAGLSQALVRGFRRRMQQIRAAKDERDLYALKSLHFEKLKGDRSDERSLRINDQWRLIVQIIEASPKNKLRVCRIVDYH